MDADAGTKPTRIAPQLYMGSAPPPGRWLADRLKAHVVVLCAEEYQPTSESWPGIEAVVHCRLDDAEADAETLRRAKCAAKTVASFVRSGRRVLVTCAQGRNRSGLVVALALRRLTGLPGEQIVRHIKRKRSHALTNHHFANYLDALPAVRKSATKEST